MTNNGALEHGDITAEEQNLQRLAIFVWRTGGRMQCNQPERQACPLKGGFAAATDIPVHIRVLYSIELHVVEETPEIWVTRRVIDRTRTGLMRCKAWPPLTLAG